ncbi:hypothetical protein [Tenacibaculum sp. 190524A02b]|uniref:hypothetical protein n=1 Tax=Tenacibaculum vairaonense TaxID=3137860 RepID=UPI0031FAE2A8
MQKEKIYHQLLQIQEHYQQQKKEHFILKCTTEHLQEFANNIATYWENPEYLTKFTQPTFEEEVILDRKQIYNSFSFFKKENPFVEVANNFQKTSIENFLMVLGQRLTPATIRNEKALPPANETVCKASFTAYNTHVTKAVRAFEKHAERSTNSFWGQVKGAPQQKENHVRQLVTQILTHKTWWNVFYHYKHELIYEVRIASGHGARWKKNNLEFIGFVEPFVDYENNS